MSYKILQRTIENMGKYALNYVLVVLFLHFMCACESHTHSTWEGTSLEGQSSIIRSDVKSAKEEGEFNLKTMEKCCGG